MNDAVDVSLFFIGGLYEFLIAISFTREYKFNLISINKHFIFRATLLS